MRLLVLLALVGLGCDQPQAASPRALRPIRLEPAQGGTLEGRVVAVHDGDTLSLESGGRRVRVRLAQIDAPEQGQPWGRRAEQALARHARRRSARLEVVDRDGYGRTVGDLFVGATFVNEALVREGHAWGLPRYVRDEGILAAEAQARREGRGLWRLPPAERVPPWEWRRSHPRRRGDAPGAAPVRPSASRARAPTASEAGLSFGGDAPRPP